MLLMTVIWATPSLAQISIGGTPPSFKTTDQGVIVQSSLIHAATLVAPDRATLFQEDFEMRKNLEYNLPPRVAICLPANYNTENAGVWKTLDTGETIWQFSIKAPGAIALLLFYDQFYIPEGGKLYIYNVSKTHVLGAYTSDNNPKYGPEFSTEMVAGDELILEYVAPAANAEQPVISISDVGYIYNEKYISVTRAVTEGQTRIPGNQGSSDYCQVNINCSEGANWQDQKKSVVATMQKIGIYGYLCSGVVVNNTARDLTPYVLMAFHCGNTGITTMASAADLNQWQFYFHWERTGCANTSSFATYRSITGAQNMVFIPHSGGSDGLLLRLNSNIPAAWDVYYSGWDSRNTPLTTGVGIHHPMGDVKKISTITNTATSAGNINMGPEYGSSAANANWRVRWSATANGHGVTEEGSSGSPIFDQNGRVVGTLSGGSSFCTFTSGTDFYGKFWYHFNQSPNADRRMKPYLDPINSGEEYIDGTYIAGSNKTEIFVTAENKQMQENDAVPALTTVVTGQLQGTHTYSNVVSSTVTTAANSMSPAGTYAIVVNSTNLLPNQYIVTNVNGILTITAYPTIITQQPTSTETFLCEGSTHTFTVAGTGLELKYQWQKYSDGFWQNIAGANASSYTIGNIKMSDAGLYRVRLSSRSSEAISEQVQLKVGINTSSTSNTIIFEWNDVPTINCNPATNGGYTFNKFQWYKNGVAIPGATKPYIQIAPGATYDCEVETTDGKTFRFCNPITYSSETALLLVYPNPASIGESMTVRLTNALEGSVVNVFDLNGGLIKANIPMHGSEAIVNISGMRAGMYIIQAVSPDGKKHTTNVVLK